MLKEKAVASLGQPSLLMPAWIKAALAANDRLKRYLTLLQSAAQHASTPDGPVGRWETDIAHAGDLGAVAFDDHAAANAAVRAGGFGYLHGVEFCVFLGSF